MWDTGCQERYQSIAPSFYRNTLGIILVYDVTSLGSFNHIKTWINQIKENATNELFIILVGSKIDLPGRRIQYEEGKALADSYGLKFFETSAKDDINVTQCFHSIVRDIKEKYLGKATGFGDDSFRLFQEKNKPAKKRCCFST